MGTLNTEDTLVEMQLLFQRRLDCLCFPPAMPLTFENGVLHTSVSLPDCFHDDLRLVRRHYAIDRALQHLVNQGNCSTGVPRNTDNHPPIMES